MTSLCRVGLKTLTQSISLALDSHGCMLVCVDGVWKTKSREKLSLGGSSVSCLLAVNREMWAACESFIHIISSSSSSHKLLFTKVCSCCWNKLVGCVVYGLWLVAWLGGRTSVFGRRTFLVLRSTCSWRVTTYVGIPSAIGQLTRPTQPFIRSGSIDE